MAIPAFQYQEPFPLGKDDTQYYLLTKDHVSVAQFEGKEILKVESEGFDQAGQGSHARLLVLAPSALIMSRWPPFCATRKPAKMTAMWL